MLKWLSNKFGKARLMRWVMTFYPPYLGAGVRVRHISDDSRDIQVLMLMENLGSRYIVWDKAADIDFIAPGKGPVFARFTIDDTLLDEVRRQTATGEKYLPQLQVDIHDGAGNLVARVGKTLYVRLKPQARQA